MSSKKEFKEKLMKILEKLTRVFAVYRMTGEFPETAHETAIKEIEKLYEEK